MDIKGITPAEWERDTINYKERFNDPGVWDSVPIYNFVNGEQFKHLQLVRFIGMVQDIKDPEIFLRKFEVRDHKTGEQSLKSGMYCDVKDDWDQTAMLEDSVNNQKDERITLYCVTIPGLNQWISVLQKARSSEILGSLLSGNSIKRTYSEMVGEFVGMAREEIREEDPHGSIQPVLDAAVRSVGEDNALNHPLKDPNGKACYATIYEWENDEFKLNEMVDMIGFFANDHYLKKLEAEDGLGCRLPPYQAPRLHVVMIKRMSYVNPLVGPADKETIMSEAANTFQNLHRLLTQVAMGDDLCAEYIIYSVVASVYDRSGENAVGHLPLNIFNVPNNSFYVEEVYSILQELVEKSHLLKMNVENLNLKKCIPTKSYERDNLVSGELQLAANTLLFVDETVLDEGQLGNNGCMNVAALKAICERQALDYDFTYYTLEYHANFSVLVFSASPSLLPCSLLVKMTPCQENISNLAAIFKAARYLGLKEPEVTAYRKFFTLVQQAECNIPAEMQTILEEAYVEFRKEDQKFGPADFHRMIILARVGSLCRGEVMLTEAAWLRTIDLERKRKQRLDKSH